MLDIKWIRDNAAALDAALEKRGADPRSADILALDEASRAVTTDMNAAQARRNEASKAIGQAMAKNKGKPSDESEALKAEVAGLKEELKALEEKSAALAGELTDILSGLPNTPYDDVPVGADEDDNLEIRKVGDIPVFDFEPKQHFDLGEGIGEMDFETAAKMSGSRFVILRNQLAKLERALGQFMLDVHTIEHGYEEVSPPVLVRDNALYGTGQLPKFEEDLFKATTDHYMIPTAEVTLTNLVADSIVDSAALPMRFSALTNCFRSEAGSAGRDTRGMIRQHQFQKCEMVSVTTADQSDEELERMTQCAETILQKLGLAYRVVKLCTGDMGFGARRTYDIEVWLPGQDQYREISSCSTCGDFQARRMKARHRPQGEKKTEFVHTLNGSGVAVGRAMVAVLENYQQADGSVVIPDVLQPYMGGQKVIAAA